jgi:DNA primase
MKLPDSFLEELRARTPLVAIVSRRVKLSRSGRQMKGCCPFHNEKTPSFYVYDDGYHCFGCGAHGDAIGFVMQTQGASFMEAVQSLASEAGMDVPKPSPTAEAAERQRLDLHAVLDAATRQYEKLLATSRGAPALAYLRQRGLTDETISRFNLGWSGEGRGALASALAADYITQGQLLEAGLLRANEDGEIRGELFFNRVMFPIRDRTGRMISFGGRILGDGQPKYVNGPETLVFSKRRTLYGLHLAREASRKGAELVAVEGYMDVIALHQAGFSGAVAPLGTALTTEQLEELWRLLPAPILCFDGDAAGARAAARAAEAALPALAPDRTIRIATLPAGEDPDTLVRRRGPDAFAEILRAARPLEEALFDLLRTSGGDQTPEQKAAFRTRLTAAAARIQDKTLAAEYRRALLDRFFTSTRRSAPDRVGPQGSFPRRGTRGAAPVVRTGPRPNPHADAANLLRARTLTAIVLEHPYLLHDVEEAYGSLPLPAEMQRLRDAILAHAAQSEDEGSQPLDSAGLINHLNALGLTASVSLALEQTPSCARKTSQPAEAEAGWWHFYGLMHRDGLEDAVEAARRSYEQTGDEAAFVRLNALCIARDRLRRGELSEDEEEGPDTFAT